MKILIATDNFHPNVNGAAKFSYALIEGLAKKGHQIYVIAPSKEFKNTVKKESGVTIYGLRSLMIPRIIYPANFRIPVTVSTAEVKKIINEVNPQIIHIQDHFMICSRAVSIGTKLKIPLVGTNHFMPENFIHYLYPPDFAKKSLSKLAWKQFINVYKHLDLITAPTKTAAQIIKSLRLKNSIADVSCGVDLDKFNPKKDGSYLKKRYKIPTHKPVLLFVGRVDKEKNIDQVIQAFSQVLASTDAHLVVAGKGKEKSNLAKLAQKLGIEKNVTFTGFVSDKDLPYLYRTADLFVIASIAELQSIATMEAMASGLPVVAANVLALPELVQNGKNGYLFNEGDIKTLAKYITKIVKDSTLQKKMSRNSLKIISHHNIKDTIKSFEQIYQKLIRAA